VNSFTSGGNEKVSHFKFQPELNKRHYYYKCLNKGV
jgi:hypothetical protein